MRALSLYIPHCSDGTAHTQNTDQYLDYFISHIVQMELASVTLFDSVTGSFISHIVQMELQYLHHRFLSLWTLYPTLFRWNNLLPLLKILKIKLYIPHCSDGTLETKLDLLSVHSLYIPHCSDGTIDDELRAVLKFDFISHIVQMEPEEIPIYFVLQITLYPTLFRWNPLQHNRILQ